ncbi:MAG: hypothetical protein ABI603_13105 [Acidobacteriota bacterium]
MTARGAWPRAWPALVGFALLAAGCGRSPRIALPSGTGTPLPDFTSAYTEATTECAAVRQLSASIRLSGRAGQTKLSARIDAGFAAPARMRLEGFPRVSFGGRPFFIFVADSRDSTLLLPHDGRVLRGAAPAEVVEALAGVPLGPADLRALVAGCGLPSGPPSAAWSYADGWVRLQTGETALFVRRLSGRWRVAGAARAGLHAAYTDFNSDRPASLQLRTDTGGVDLRLRFAEVEVDPSFDPRVFEVEVPSDAAPLTIEELRRTGPLASEGPTAR